VIDPPRFEVDEIMLAEYSRFRERAGLYAWQETANNVSVWPELHQQAIAEHAIDSIELTRADPTVRGQLALFDPEFQQWHFVPYTNEE
jgi:hypothetical protein